MTDGIIINTHKQQSIQAMSNRDRNPLKYNIKTVIRHWLKSAERKQHKNFQTTERPLENETYVLQVASYQLQKENTVSLGSSTYC